MSIIDRDKVIHDLGMRLRQIGRAQVGRILGTVLNTDGNYKAMIDLLERSYFLRAEVNALASLLIAKGVFTHPEFAKQVEEEMRIYFKACAAEWPELEFTPTGITVLDPPACGGADEARAMAPLTPYSEITVHILFHGRSLCNMPGVPREWPDGHKWVSTIQEEVGEANCGACLERFTARGGELEFFP